MPTGKASDGSKELIPADAPCTARYTAGDVTVVVTFDLFRLSSHGKVMTAVRVACGGGAVLHVSPFAPSQVGVPVTWYECLKNGSDKYVRLT